jgi:drug/metabolite transporter (DMT)-like permease
MSAASTATHLRGLTAGLITGALALAAHGFADQMAPSGGTVALLAVVSAAFGALVSRWPRTSHASALIGVLGLGQVVGHLTLSAGGSMHIAQPSPPMLAAHAAAVVVGALLVAACERLYTALSSAIRRYRSACAAVNSVGAQRLTVHVAPPQQRIRLLAASISHRGPPLGAVR